MILILAHLFLDIHLDVLISCDRVFLGDRRLLFLLIYIWPSAEHVDLLIVRVGVMHVVDFEESARNGPPVFDLKVRPFRVLSELYLEVLEGGRPLSKQAAVRFSFRGGPRSLFAHFVLVVATIN